MAAKNTFGVTVGVRSMGGPKPIVEDTVEGAQQTENFTCERIGRGGWCSGKGDKSHVLYFTMHFTFGYVVASGTQVLETTGMLGGM